MTNLEFELLDEIYFVQSFGSLSGSLRWSDDIILATLKSLNMKGWIRCYYTPTEEVAREDINLDGKYKEYHYLASKDGLIAHNSIE